MSAVPRSAARRRYRQTLRRGHRARWRVADAEAGRNPRHPRRQRRRQIDADQDPHRLPNTRPAASCLSRRRGNDAALGRSRPLARHRMRLSGPGAGQFAQRLSQHVPEPGDRASRPVSPVEQSRDAPAARRNVWKRSACTCPRSICQSNSFPAGSVRRSPSRARSIPRMHASCCSTNRWPRWARARRD